MAGPITPNTTNLITVLLLPVAILMIAYALATFYMRSVYLQKKQVCAHGSLVPQNTLKCFITLRLLHFIAARALLLQTTATPSTCCGHARWAGEGLKRNMNRAFRFARMRVFPCAAQMGFYMDWIGPTVLCALVMVVLTTIMVVAFIDIFSYH